MSVRRVIVSEMNRLTVGHSGNHPVYILVLDDGSRVLTSREWEGDLEPCGWNNTLPLHVPVDLVTDESGIAYGFFRVDPRVHSVPTEPIKPRP